MTLTALSFVRCQNFYVTNEVTDPNIHTTIPLFEGVYSWAEIIKKDSLSKDANAITFEQSVLNQELDFSSLIPDDSSYYQLGSGFTINNGLTLEQSDTLVFNQDQQSVINVFAPQLSSVFSNNNLSNIQYLGFTKNGMSQASPVFLCNSIYSSANINEGRLYLKVVNTLDIPSSFTLSVLSGNDTTYKTHFDFTQADTITKDLNIAGRDLFKNNRVVISNMSSEYTSKTPISIDNNNGIHVEACFYNLRAKTGNFYPNPILIQQEETITIPIKSPNSIRSFFAKKLVFNHEVNSGDLEGSVKLRREVFDKTGLVFSDSIYLFNTTGSNTWPLDLSGMTLTPDDGMLKVVKTLIINDDIHLSLGNFPFVATNYNFSPGIEFVYFESNEEKSVQISETTYPKTLWENGLTVDMIPKSSTYQGKLNILGWGDVVHNALITSVTDGQITSYLDTTTLSLGNNVADSTLNLNLAWDVSSEKLGEAIYFLADEIQSTSTLILLPPWGIVVDASHHVEASISSPLNASQGSFYLSTTKEIENNFNDLLLEQLYSNDSLKLITQFQHNRDTLLNVKWSIANGLDTLDFIDSTFINELFTSEKSTQVEQLLKPLQWNMNVGFDGDNIIIRNRDSLKFKVSLKYFNEP